MDTPATTREQLTDLAERLECIEPKTMDDAATLDEAVEVIRSISDHPLRLRVVGMIAP